LKNLSFRHPISYQMLLNFFPSKHSKRSQEVTPWPSSSSSSLSYQRHPPSSEMVPNGIRNNPRNAQAIKSKFPKSPGESTLK